MSEADHNLRGIHFGMPAESEWSTRGVTAYLIFRLAWEPEADLREIAEDYAAIYVGRDAAPQLAEILLLSQQAYKDGIYIKPVAESLSWNTLPHLRITTFDVQGFPRIDAGREHIEWLRSSMYEPSKGRIDEALEYLERGRGAANRMAETYVDAEPRIADRALAKRIADSLELTRLLVETNLLYVKTCYAYFQYREEPGPETKERLAETLTALKETREKFARAPGFEYKLFGIDQLIDSADDALEDLERAEARFANAPDEAKLAKAIQEQQKLHAAALKTLRNETVRFLSWRGKIDGVDVLSVSGDEVTLNHIQSDAPHSIDQRVFEELPAREVTVLLRDVESQTIHPYVLEQPTEANGYTAKVCLCDRTKGYSWWEFELYYVDKPPAELGLAIPWQEAGDRV